MSAPKTGIISTEFLPAVGLPAVLATVKGLPTPAMICMTVVACVYILARTWLKK